LDEDAAILESLVPTRLMLLLMVLLGRSEGRGNMHTGKESGTESLASTTALDMTEIPSLPSSDVLEHIVDVHCHPTDEAEIADDVMNNLHIKICAMATNSNDQQRVAGLAMRFPDNV